jgi:hypothetical protein
MPLRGRKFLVTGHFLVKMIKWIKLIKLINDGLYGRYNDRFNGRFNGGFNGRYIDR